jgi:hypothetical protein
VARRCPFNLRPPFIHAVQSTVPTSQHEIEDSRTRGIRTAWLPLNEKRTKTVTKQTQWRSKEERAQVKHDKEYSYGTRSERDARIHAQLTASIQWTRKQMIRLLEKTMWQPQNTSD